MTNANFPYSEEIRAMLARIPVIHGEQLEKL